MARQIVSSLIDALLAIPPIRFVMGLVDARWRPLWAALWLAVIAYVASRTLNQLTLRRARARLLRDPGHADAHATIARPGDPPANAASTSADEQSASEPRPAPPPQIRDRGRAPPMVPVTVIGVAIAVGAVAVGMTAAALRRAPNDADRALPFASPDTTVAASASAGTLDLRWRSGRMSDDDCIGTFEVTHGSPTPARFVAFVSDSSGNVMARDSARVESAVAGLLVEFRFRHVDCDEIADWQLQALTPKTARD